MPQRQCCLPAVRRRGGRRRDATGSSQSLDGAPWRGAWPEFQRRVARRGAEEGDAFAMVMGMVLGRVRNGFRPRRRGADVWGP
jgi:hypothetical protein